MKYDPSVTSQAEGRIVRGKLRGVLAASLVLAGCSAILGSTADQASDTLALVNGTLIDGTGAAPVTGAVLVIAGGRISAAGRDGQVQIPEAARVIDVHGATILPGFINAHVHDAYSARNLEMWASAGVTTVRDEGILPGNPSLADLISRRDREWSAPRYARLVSAGWMVTAPHGYGFLFVSSAADARQRVGEELDQGANLVKVALEDGYGPRTDLPLLSNEALAGIVAAAHARGAPVSAHVTEAQYLQTVVDAGVDDAAHMPWDEISDALMQRMIARHIAVTPTLTVMEAYGVLAGSSANLGRFVAHGGVVALGSDYTNVPQNGFDHFELGMPMHEIRRMADAGMTPIQVIVAATRNAARVCGLERELGTLEVGKAADVLVVKGDPLRELGALTDVRLVIHRGTVIRE